jgi:hypothetical protein
MDQYREHLLDEAISYWSRGEQLPVDLTTNMLTEGLDVAALERIYLD